MYGKKHIPGAVASALLCEPIESLAPVVIADPLHDLIGGQRVARVATLPLPGGAQICPILHGSPRRGEMSVGTTYRPRPGEGNTLWGLFGEWPTVTDFGGWATAC
jgi:hypothetical protein